MSHSHVTRHVIKIIESNGFVFVSQKGSHAKYRHRDGRVVIVPLHGKDLPFGTFLSIVRQSQISHEHFDE